MSPSELTASAPTISSQEIAALTGKRHDNVVADIKKTLGEAGITALNFQASYKDASGKKNICYQLPRFECDLVVSGYSFPYRAMIIRRWHELEAEKAKPLSRREQLIRDLAEIDLARTGSVVVDGIRPINTYGSKAPNGNRRLGLRRAAWVASRRSRLEDALVIHRELRDLDQAELALGFEGGAE